MYDPLHSSHPTAIFQFNPENKMAVAGVGVNAAISYLNLELLQQDRNTSAPVLVPLEHASENQRSRNPRGQFG
jgi:hypothetical protein